MDAALTATASSWVAIRRGVGSRRAGGFVYVVGWLRLRRRGPDAAPVWRLALYGSGLTALVVALLSPIEP